MLSSCMYEQAHVHNFQIFFFICSLFSPSGQEEGQATAQGAIILIPMHGSQKPAVNAIMKLEANIFQKQTARKES